MNLIMYLIFRVSSTDALQQFLLCGNMTLMRMCSVAVYRQAAEQAYT